MNKLLKLLCILLSSIALISNAQDSSINNTNAKDSVNILMDTLALQNNFDSTLKDSLHKNLDENILPVYKNISWQKDTAFTKLLGFTNQEKNTTLKNYDGKQRIVDNDDILFYSLLFIIFFLGITKAAFPKYFNNIFSLSFQATFRQGQTRDQITQNQLPGLMLNLLFILSAGLFIALLAGYNNWSQLAFWKLFSYSSVILSIIYLGKHLFIQFAGWVFNAKDATETYIFIVFLVNKIMGIVLLPFSFIIAFSQTAFINVGVTISLMFILVLFSYRYIASINPIKRELKISFFHFVFYILAFEITPLLLLYKTLGYYLAKST